LANQKLDAMIPVPAKPLSRSADKSDVLNTSIRAVIIAIFLACFTQSSFAQPVRVPGTGVTLSPPQGFAAARRYPGFEDPHAQATIMVTELPVDAAEMIRSMTKPALATKGITVVSAHDLVVNDRPARLLEVRQTAAGVEVGKWMLIAGDTRTTVMVVGAFIEAAAPGIGDAIRESLLTTSWGTAAPVSGASGSANPFEGLPFRLTATAKLKLASRVSNMLMFTESGTTGSPGSTEALYIAGSSLGQVRVGQIRNFAESRARQTTLTKSVTNFTGRPVQVAGLDAYELEADASDARSGRAMRLYQVIIPDETGYVVLQGLVRADRASEIVPEFKALTATFRTLSAP
jgi:hypothetical protein